MKVTLKDDDWSTVPQDYGVGIAFKNGDLLPIQGEEYQVIGFANDDIKKVKGYELSGFPGFIFREERFEVTNTDFIPDCVIDGKEISRMNMYSTFAFSFNVGKMPRKKKKHFKKYGMSFFHPGIDKTKITI